MMCGGEGVKAKAKAKAKGAVNPLSTQGHYNIYGRPIAYFVFGTLRMTLPLILAIILD